MGTQKSARLKWRQKTKSFHSLQTGKPMGTYPIFDPRHAWLRNPESKHELRGAFSNSKIGAKNAETLINTDSNAIF